MRRRTLREDTEVVHVVAVNGHISSASGHDMEVAYVFLKLDPDHYTARFSLKDSRVAALLEKAYPRSGR
jgi:hypothetical protein